MTVRQTLPRCALCEREMFSRGEGEMCPRCVEQFARHAARNQPPLSIFDDPAGVFVGALLVVLVGLLTCAFYPI